MSSPPRKLKDHLTLGTLLGLAGMLHRKGRRKVSVREMDRAIERLHCSDYLLGRQYGTTGLHRAKQR